MTDHVPASPPHKIKVFINYRREDSAGHAGRLSDKIRSYFGNRIEIFIDTDSIAAGEDFINVIENAVGECDILVAIIGRDWLTVADKAGNRRLHKSEDFVRVEIAAALNRNIRVIPVLVQGASMPPEEQLPESLAKLTRRQAIEVSDGRWKYDTDRLVKTIEESLGLQPIVNEPAQGGHTWRGAKIWWLWPWKILAFMLGIGIIWFLVWMVLLYLFPPSPQVDWNTYTGPRPGVSNNGNARSK